MNAASADITPNLLAACAEFWRTYYAAMLRLHTDSGRTLQDPIRDRKLGTTNSRHIAVFERFWRRQLASALGVPESEVVPRRIRFRPHRSKTFDVCWPRTGEPRILISIKSMQNAYRNLTNRIEEAIGDSAGSSAIQLQRSVWVLFLYLAWQGSLWTERARGVATDHREQGNRPVPRSDRGGR